MNTPFNVDNWMDVIAYLVIGLPALVAAVATWRSQERYRARFTIHEASQQAVLDEVKNSHKTNLRDDIDALGAAITKGFIDVNHQIDGLRAELRTERVERIEGDRRIR